jgi:hypothetical protein
MSGRRHFGQFIGAAIRSTESSASLKRRRGQEESFRHSV